MTSTAPTLTEDQSQNLPPSAAPPPPVLQDVPTARLMPHPRNPRRDLGDLTDLTASIRQQGVLEPLVVVPKGRASFLVIAGHRRAAAAKLAKVKTVPCVVREDLIDDRQQVAAMLVENLHRADLTPVEEAAAYEQLLLDDALTVDALAAVVGQPVKRVQSRLKLRKLSPGMQDQIHAGQLTIEQGLAIGEFTDDPKAAARLAKAAGTPNWGWELARARGDRKDARAIDRRIAKMLKSGQITLTHEDVDEQAQALADERAEAAAQRDAADAATAAAYARQARDRDPCRTPTQTRELDRAARSLRHEITQIRELLDHRTTLGTRTIGSPLYAAPLRLVAAADAVLDIVAPVPACQCEHRGRNPTMTDQHPDQTRYLKAMHAVQTGTALEHAAGSPDGQPKHLRVGITSTQITDAALAGLLIERGLFTLEEYRKAIADEAEMAQARYELRLGVNLV